MLTSRRPWLGLVAVALAAAFATPARAQEKATLRLRLKQGQPYSITMTADQKIAQTINGNPQNTTQTMGVTFTLLPSKVEPDGTIHGTYTYDAVRVKMNGPGGAVDYDSAKGGEAPTHPMARVFAALVGQKLDVVMAPDGRVTDLKGGDRLVEAIAKAVEIPEAARAGFEQQMKAQFGEDALKRNFEQMTAIYPKEPVAVGDTWEAEQRLSLGMPMTVKSTYSLKSLAGGKATVDVRGTMQTDPEAAGGLPNATFDLKGTQNGTMAIDQATGWILSANLEQDIGGSFTVNAAGQELDVPMTIKSTTTLEAPEAKE